MQHARYTSPVPKSSATTVDAFLAALPDERRAVIEAVRAVIRKNLPEGYVESVSSGMLSYEIPLETYPNTYNRKPLGYVALAAQKNGYSLYLIGPYVDPAQAEELKAAFAAAGKKLDMGKSCVRFRKLEDLELTAIARTIASMPPQTFIKRHEASLAK